MRIVLVVLVVVALACGAGCVWLVQAFHVEDPYGAQRTTTFYVEGLDSGRLYFLLTLAAAFGLVAAAAVGLALSRRIANRGMRRTLSIGLTVLLVLGVPLAGFRVIQVGLSSAVEYTVVEGARLTRDLVVREWSFLFAGGGQVFEREGTILTLVGRVGADDGQMPFHSGEYTATEVDGVVTLEWEFAPGSRSELVIGR